MGLLFVVLQEAQVKQLQQQAAQRAKEEAAAKKEDEERRRQVRGHSKLQKGHGRQAHTSRAAGG